MMTPEDVNQWIKLGSALLALIMFIWRNSLGTMFWWFVDALKAPMLIRQQNEVIAGLAKSLLEVRNQAVFAVATARIAWSFVERPVLQFDAFGDCVCVNDFSMRAFARQQDEYLGKGWLTLIHQDDSDRVDRLWAQCVKEKRNFVQEFRIYHRDGRIIRVLDRAEVMRDYSTDEVLGWHHLMSIIVD